MSTLAITGWSALTPYGAGTDAFTAGWRARRPALRDVSGMYDDDMPSEQACAMTDFNVRDHLGRKGTSVFDRSTSMAVVASGLALRDSELTVTDDISGGIGLILGLTNGGPQAMCEFIREMFVNERPYLVNPLRFPHAVMNGAAGAAAIWHRLRGVNATVSGGQMAFLSALRYAAKVIRHDHVRVACTGALEEFTPQRAWASHLTRGELAGRVPLGEGAAFFVIEAAERARENGRRIDAEILAVESGLFTEDTAADGLAGVIGRALDRAGVQPSDVRLVAPSFAGSARRDSVERAALLTSLGDAGQTVLPVKQLLGETYTAAGALQLATILAEHRDNEALDGAVSLVTSLTSEGVVGAAVVRGWSRGSRHHRV